MSDSVAAKVQLEMAPTPARENRRHIDRIVMVCLFVMCVLVAVAILAPWIAPQDPLAIDMANKYAGPSTGHPLGTDSLGRDLLSRLVYGARPSLLGPTLITVFCSVVGSIVALSAAWRGGWFDQLVVRILDVMFAFPSIILALLAVAMFGNGLLPPALALGLAYVPYVARVVRTAARRERHLAYIQACFAGGMSARQVVFRHLLHNVSPIILVQSTISFAYAMIGLAAVSYLGLGVAPPTPEWGLMVATGQSSILSGHPQESLYAGLMIVVVVVVVHQLGNRLAVLILGGKR